MGSKIHQSPFAETEASPRSVLATPQVTPPPPPPAELDEPLLSTRISSYYSTRYQGRRVERFQAAAHLAKSILGVGLLALPRVVSLLGLGAGAICLAGAALLAYASLHVLTKASGRTGTLNLSALVRTSLGVVAQTVLDLALILNCFGRGSSLGRGRGTYVLLIECNVTSFLFAAMLVIYLVVMGDLLVGSAGNPGLLTPDCGNRRIVLAVITLLVLVPLLSLRYFCLAGFQLELNVCRHRSSCTKAYIIACTAMFVA